MKEFYKALSQDAVKFVYRKANGELRKALGTTSLTIIPEDSHPTGKVNNKIPSNKRYWDLNSKAWRAFDETRLLWTPQTGFTEYATEVDKEEITDILSQN